MHSSFVYRLRRYLNLQTSNTRSLHNISALQHILCFGWKPKSISPYIYSLVLSCISTYTTETKYSSTLVTAGGKWTTHQSLHSCLGDYHPARQHTGTISSSHITTGHTRYCKYITILDMFFRNCGRIHTWNCSFMQSTLLLALYRVQESYFELITLLTRTST